MSIYSVTCPYCRKVIDGQISYSDAMTKLHEHIAHKHPKHAG